jgi:hypothetical protein
MARGFWTMSVKDRGQAQYAADQIAGVLGAQQARSNEHLVQLIAAHAAQVAEQLNEAYRRGWQDGRAAAMAERH